MRAAAIIMLLLLATAAGAAELRRAYVDAGPGQLHLRIAGPPNTDSERPPLVALHLVPNSGQVFDRFLPLISEDRTAIAFDLPGFGMSDPVDGPETIEAYANAILDGLDQLGIVEIDLLGYHTGAAVSAEIIRQRPQFVRRVILAAIPVLTQVERDRYAALPPIAFDEAGEFAKQEWQRSMHWRGPGQTVDSVKRTYAEKMRPGARERGATAVVGYDLGAVLPLIDKPTLVMRPKDDLWEATARARPLLSEALWVELPHYGHGLFEVAAGEMAALVDCFLGDAEATSCLPSKLP